MEYDGKLQEIVIEDKGSVAQLVFKLYAKMRLNGWLI
jgi:hypothetical protein